MVRHRQFQGTNEPQTIASSVSHYYAEKAERQMNQAKNQTKSPGS